MSTLYRGGFVYSPIDPFANAMVVDDATGTIAWIGGDDAAAVHGDAVDRVVELDGALVTPAFVDAHVHATSTGLALTVLDLHSSSSLAETVAQVARFAQRSPGIVLGTGWDETGWPERRGLTRADLDAVLDHDLRRDDERAFAEDDVFTDMGSVPPQGRDLLAR